MSAFDRFMHDFVVERFMKILINKEQIPQKANQLKIGFNLLCLLHHDSSAPEYDKVESELRKILSWQSFQHPGKVSGVLSSLFNIDVWDEISTLLSMPTNDAKNQLELIVDRRDKIAHESDIRPESISSDIEKYPITVDMVKDTLIYMTKLVSAINTLS